MPTYVAQSASAQVELFTAEEFLDWLEPGRFADLIGGEVFMHSPVSLPHARLTSFIDRLLAAYIEHHDLGEIFREHVAVRFDRRNAFLPDHVFFKTSRLHLLRRDFIDVPPDLVIEVLSKATAKRDITKKFIAYEKHGVGEYWILDPVTLSHSFYRHNGDLFVEVGHGEPSFTSEVLPGFTLEKNWLDPDNLPKVQDCLEGLL
jgi:Uma2 family endonuclease